MKTEDQVQAPESHLSTGMRLILSQESPPTPRSSRASSRSSTSSSSSSSSRDSSYSSSDRSRSRSVSRRPRRRHRHGSRYSSSSSSSGSSRYRSRSRPRCCRASYHSRCRHRQRSRSYSPYSRRAPRYGRRRYSRSVSRSSSRERYYKRSSRRSGSRSSSYRRESGRFRCRFSPSPPVSRYYRRRSRSPESSVRLSVKDKLDLLNIARENAAKSLGVEVVDLPASVRWIEEKVAKKVLKSDTEKRVRADQVPVKEPRQDEGESDEDTAISKTSPPRKPISFSVSNAVAKPSSSPTHHVTESKVTSRADSVGNRMPYGRWIPVKEVSCKKR